MSNRVIQQNKRLLVMHVLLCNLIYASTLCSQELQYDGNRCATEYTSKMSTHLTDPNVNVNDVMSFRQYLKYLPLESYNWYTFWSDEATVNISYCIAILPIDEQLQANCLCELKYICNDICSNKIQNAFMKQTNVFLNEYPYTIPYEAGVTHRDCQEVMESIHMYEVLCSNTDMYQSIQECALFNNTTAEYSTTSESISNTNIMSTDSSVLSTKININIIDTELIATESIGFEDTLKHGYVYQGTEIYQTPVTPHPHVFHLFGVAIPRMIVIIVIIVLGVIACTLCVCILFKSAYYKQYLRHKQYLSKDHMLDDDEQIEGEGCINMYQIESNANYIDYEGQQTMSIAVS